MSKENNLDFIRLFAAFCVMVYHAVHHLDYQFLWLSKEGGLWFNDGVEIFFIMSGLLVYKSYLSSVKRGHPLIHYYKNRFLRVAPAIYSYVIITIFILFLIGAIGFGDINSTQFMAWLASNFLLVPVFHPETFEHIGIGVLNGSLWTIPVEFSFYIIVPLIFLFEKKIGFKKTLAILFALWLLSFSAVTFIENENVILKLFGVTFAPYLLYFGLGIFWGKYWSKVPQKGYYALGALLVYIFFKYIILDVNSGIIGNIIWSGALSYVVMWFAFNGPKMFNNVTKFGDLSFGIYIWHMVVVNVFLYLDLDRYFKGWNETLVLFSVFLVTFSLAIISWNLVEKQALKLKPYSSNNKKEDGHMPTVKLQKVE